MAALVGAVLHAASAAAFTPDAFIRVRRSCVQPVDVPPLPPAPDGDALSLSTYMRLPVEQYTTIPLPLRAELVLASDVWPERTGANDFALRVPPLTFPIPGVPLTVEPLCFARVRPQESCVLISSDECTLSGSAFVESLRLNERFTFQVRMQLTWDDDGSASNRDVRPCMLADTRVEVDVDTPPLFALVPRRLLEGIASGAMTVVLDTLQRAFLRNLAADYTRWATDARYRESRSQRKRA